MARTRNLKPGFFLNEQLAECHPLTRLFFQGLWCLADREGRLENRPKRLKAAILPYDECDISGMLCDLQMRGFVIVYERNKCQFIQIVNFTKHQCPHIKEAPSTIPAPDKHGASMEVAAPSSLTLNPSSLTLKEPEYEFFGKVLKLTECDYRRWEKSFSSLNGSFRGLLESRDAWLSEQPVQVQKKWFQSTAAWLANKNSEAAGRDKPKPKTPSYGVVVGSPEWKKLREAGQI